MNAALIRGALNVFAGLVFGMLVAPPVLTFGGEVFYRVFPVMVDWKPTSVLIEGADVVVSGSVVKRWDCRYEPPPRAVDERGQHVEVVSSSPTAKLSWQTGESRFGPWRAVGGAGKRLKFYQHHVCFRVFEVFTDLGEVDASRFM